MSRKLSAMLIVFGFFALTLFQNCSSVGSPVVAVVASGNPEPEAPVNPAGQAPSSLRDLSLSFCSNVLTVAHGRLCAVQPSQLDARTKDIYGNGNAADRNLGFGFHAIAVPDVFDPTKGLWIHITGTYGRPFHQGGMDFGSKVWLDEILERGYIVIQLAYDNRFSVNSDTCQSPNPGANRDNCAGEVREEVLTGADLSPYRQTDIYNSVDFRLKILLNYLKSQSGSLVPEGIDAENFDWSKVTVSGHSQGGNLAYYVAKNRGVKFACMLASPYDVADSVNPAGRSGLADWFTTGPNLTPLARLGQFVTVEDDSYNAFHNAAVFLGMTVGKDAFESALGPYHDEAGEVINGHAAAVNDPSLKAFRAQACFR